MTLVQDTGSAFWTISAAFQLVSLLYLVQSPESRGRLNFSKHDSDSITPLFKTIHDTLALPGQKSRSRTRPRARLTGLCEVRPQPHDKFLFCSVPTSHPSPWAILVFSQFFDPPRLPPTMGRLHKLMPPILKASPSPRFIYPSPGHPSDLSLNWTSSESLP